MGLRFRKSFKIAPGVRVNLNKKSASVSFGPKGLKHTVSTTGKSHTTVGIPGTGLSYTTTGGGSRPSSVPSAQRPTSPKSKAVVLPLCIFLGMFGVHRYYVGKIGTGVIWMLTAGFFGIGWIVDIFTVALGGFYDVSGYVVRFHPTEAELEEERRVEEYLGQTPAEAWAVWDGCHDFQPQKDRRARAMAGDLMPDAVDAERKVATFVGGRGDHYTTTLLSCTCPDFAERGKPCKHMYFLAHELGADAAEE